MRYRCSWCITKGRKPAEWQDSQKLPPDLPPGTVSHGLCKECADELDKELDSKKTEDKANGKTDQE